MSYGAPYAGLKVVDVSLGFAGPYCAGLFSLQGADVIKVEPPRGDWMRGIGRAFANHTPHDLVANRGKRSIALDLNQDAAREVVLRMASDCDLFIESWRPGVATHRGIDYAAIKAVNPGVIYVSISGFGQDGPYNDRPGTDTVIQAYSGLISVNRGQDGVPHRVGMLVPDTVTGVYAHQAAAAALFAKRHEPEGTYLDISLTQAMGAFLAPKIIEWHLEDGEPRLLNAPAGTFETKDGFIAITLVKEPQWASICEAMGLPELTNDDRYNSFEARAANIEALRWTMNARLREKTTADWISIMREKDILCDFIKDFGEWLDDENVKASGLAPMISQPGIGAMPFPTIPGVVPDPAGDDSRPAPDIGAHGLEILTDHGYDDDAIAALRKCGALMLADGTP